MCAWHETSDIEEFDGNGAAAVDAGAIVRFAAVGCTDAGACAGDLEVTDGALGVDSCEASSNLH